MFNGLKRRALRRPSAHDLGHSVFKKPPPYTYAMPVGLYVNSAYPSYCTAYYVPSLRVKGRILGSRGHPSSHDHDPKALGVFRTTPGGSS